MRGVPIGKFGSSFLLWSLLAFSEAHRNEPVADNIGPESNPRLKDADKLEPRVSSIKAPTKVLTEDRLKQDGFLSDSHADSALEHDLTDKLKAIYERYYEVADQLGQADGHNRELTKQLMQTKLELANYKVYKNDLMNRLKKTEMYLTVLLKKSKTEIEMHQIDLNPPLNAEVAKKNSLSGEENQGGDSRSSAVVNGNVKEGATAEGTPKENVQVSVSGSSKMEPHVNVKTHVDSVKLKGGNKTADKDIDHVTSDPNTPSTEKSRTNQTIDNGSKVEDVLAQIDFNFREKPSQTATPQGPALRGGLFDRVPDVPKKPSGPLVKNVTVVLRANAKTKDKNGVSLTDWEFGTNLGNMGFRLFESDSEEQRHTNYQYVRGEPGSAGLPGTPGTPGSPGLAGAAGINGAVGPTGAAGQKGEPGSGVAGVNGVNGAVGVTGNPGLPGPTGLAGATGAVGAKGVLGVQGSQGAKGIKGVTGDTG